MGSTEYAVKVLGVKLIMVLGHSDCGAVHSAIGVANGTSSYPPDKYGEIGAVVNHLLPPIAGIPPEQRTVPRSVAVNAQFQAANIAGRGPIVQQAIAAGKLRSSPPSTHPQRQGEPRLEG